MFFQFGDARAQRRDGLLEFGGSVARRDVFGTVPIERHHLNLKNTLDDFLHRWVGEFLRKGGMLTGIKHFGMAHDFQAHALWVIHQEQRRTVVVCEVAGGQHLAVASIIREGQTALARDFQKARPSAAMLDIRPAVRRDCRQIKTVARLDELGFVRREQILLRLRRDELRGAVKFFLRRKHRRREVRFKVFSGHNDLAVGERGGMIYPPHSQFISKHQRLPAVREVFADAQEAGCAGHFVVLRLGDAAGFHALGRAERRRTSARACLHGLPHGVVERVERMPGLGEFARPARSRAYEVDFHLVAGLNAFLRERQRVERATIRLVAVGFRIANDDDCSFHIFFFLWLCCLFDSSVTEFILFVTLTTRCEVGYDAEPGLYGVEKLFGFASGTDRVDLLDPAHIFCSLFSVIVFRFIPNFREQHLDAAGLILLTSLFEKKTCASIFQRFFGKKLRRGSVFIQRRKVATT